MAQLGVRRLIVPLRPLDDTSAVDWFLDADADWWTRVCLGPPGFEAYARLQLVDDVDGELDLSTATTSALRRILPRHTSTPETFFGQWTGSGWDPPIRPGRLKAALFGQLAPDVNAEVRDYWLFVGDLDDLAPWDDIPHLIWPADHAWFVAADVDPDWIGVGGTRTLIDEILASPGLDAAPSAYDASDWEVR